MKPTGPGRPIVSMVIDGFESVFQISISSQNLHGSACCAAAVATRRRTARPATRAMPQRCRVAALPPRLPGPAHSAVAAARPSLSRRVLPILPLPPQLAVARLDPQLRRRAAAFPLPGPAGLVVAAALPYRAPPLPCLAHPVVAAMRSPAARRVPACAVASWILRFQGWSVQPDPPPLHRAAAAAAAAVTPLRRREIIEIGH